MKKRLQDVTAMVIKALKSHPTARNSDDYLYYIVYKEILGGMGIDIDRVSASNVLLYRDKYSLPPFTSMRRARQKAQVKFPELAAVPEVEEARGWLEAEYREYARGAI